MSRSYTNVHLDTSTDVADRRGVAMLKADLEFWKDRAERLQRVLENIPAAVEEWGEVEITHYGKTVTLIAKPDPAVSPLERGDPL